MLHPHRGCPRSWGLAVTSPKHQMENFSKKVCHNAKSPWKRSVVSGAASQLAQPVGFVAAAGAGLPSGASQHAAAASSTRFLRCLLTQLFTALF